MLLEVTDEPTPEDLEQLAMSGVLGERDHLDAVTALRRLAEIDKAKRRSPIGVEAFVAQGVEAMRGSIYCP